MTETKTMHSSAIHECTRNYRIRSWVYAILGLWAIMTGYAVFLETRPYTAILGIILGVMSVRASEKGKINAAQYVGAAVVVLGILEWITCFM